MVGNDSLLHFTNTLHDESVCNILGSVAHVVIDKEYAGYIIISDKLKDDTVEAVNKLYKAGIKNIIISLSSIDTFTPLPLISSYSLIE